MRDQAQDANVIDEADEFFNDSDEDEHRKIKRPTFMSGVILNYIGVREESDVSDS